MEDPHTTSSTPLPPQAPLPAVWGLVPTLIFSALIAVATVFLQSVVLMLLFVDPALVQDPQAMQEQFSALATNGTAISVAAWASMTIVATLVALAISLKPGAQAHSYLGLHLPTWSAALGWLRWLMVYIVIHELLSLALGRPLVNPFMQQIADSADDLWMLALALLIAAPLSEELFFRGFLLTGLARSAWGGRIAVVLTAAVWSVIHTQYDAFDQASVFVVGLLLGAARLRSGSLWLCIGLHAVINLVALLELLAIRGLT